MSSAPLVSVIIPVYNQVRYVEESIRSVLAQTYPEFELLIIDDASTDGTDKVIARFETDERVSIHRNEENLGCARSCNLGYALACGEYYGIIAGDDTYEPEFLTKCVSALESHPDAGFAYTRVNLMDEAGNRKPRVKDRIIHRENHYGAEFENIVRWLNPIPHGAALVRKKCADEVGHYDPELTAGYDWEFWIRLSRKFPAVFINEHLMNYRVHEANITKRRAGRGERERGFIRLLDEVFGMEDLPESLLREKDMIYARAYLDIAEGYRDIGEYDKMRRFAAKAFSLCKKPSLYLPYRRLMLSLLNPACR